MATEIPQDIEEQLKKLNLKIARPQNLDLSENATVEATAISVDKQQNQSEDHIINDMLAYFGDPKNTLNFEISIMLDGSIPFYVNLLEKIKQNSDLIPFFERIHFRFVFKPDSSTIYSTDEYSRKRFSEVHNTKDDIEFFTYSTDRTDISVKVGADDIFDKGESAALPLAIQLAQPRFKMYAYSRKFSSPASVPPEGKSASYRAISATPHDSLVIFNDEWIYSGLGMNSSRYESTDWEINMYERLCRIPLTATSEGDFNTSHRDGYLNLLKSLRTKRNGDTLEDIYRRLGQTQNVMAKAVEMFKIHNELVAGTKLPRFNSLQES